MDFEEKLRSLTVGDFITVLEDSPRHDFGPHSINRRVCGFLGHVYGHDGSMWDVVVDGPAEWRFAAGCGPKIIEALAKAINIEMGAPIVPTAVPTKERREEGYFWTKERLTEVAHKLDGGASYREVAMHYGKNVDGMKAALKRYGLYQPRFNAQWQPIETAPKDRSILVTGANGLRIDQVIWGGWELDNTHNWCDADGDRHCNAGITHWMPLPPPPK